MLPVYGHFHRTSLSCLIGDTFLGKASSFRAGETHEVIQGTPNKVIHGNLSFCLQLRERMVGRTQVSQHNQCFGLLPLLPTPTYSFML